MSVVDMGSYRAPVTYTITVTHHWDGVVEAEIYGLADDDRSRRCAAQALLDVAAKVERQLA